MLEKYEKTIAELRTEFVEICKSVFGDNLITIMAKGSTVKGGFIPGLSDVDLHVYLKDEAFEFSDFLKLELGLTLQEKMGKLIKKYDLDGSPIQLILLNTSSPKENWAGPIPGTYILLYGDECPESAPDKEEILEQDLRNLQDVTYPYGLINSFVDKADDTLPSYVRRLSPAVTPILNRVLSLLTKDPFKAWKMSKSEAIKALEKSSLKEARELATLTKDFYHKARQKDKLRNELQFCRETIRTAFKAINQGRIIGSDGKLKLY